MEEQKPKKKKKGCLIAIVVVLAILLFGCVGLGLLGDDEGAPVSSSSEGSAEVQDVTFEEQTLYEGNDVVMTLTGSEQTSSGIDLNILIENNSSKNLGFNAHSYSVNGIMTRNNIYDMDTDVAAGQKANTALTINNSFLKNYGISEVRYIDVLFWAYDNDEMFKDFETDVVRIKSDLNDDKRDVIEGEEIFSNDGVKIEVLSIDGDTASFVLTNETGSYFDFDVEGITFNGYTTSDTDYDLFDEEVHNDSQIWFEIVMSDDFKEQNGIDSIENIQFYLKYRPLGDYFNEKTTDVISASVG